MAISLAFLFCGALLLIGVYGLRAAGVIDARTSSVLYGCILIAVGLGFLVFCILLFTRAGETLKFQRGGPFVIDPDESGFTHFLGWIVIGAISWRCIESGWNLVTKGHDRD